jgi:hypothetical protein
MASPTERARRKRKRMAQKAKAEEARKANEGAPPRWTLKAPEATLSKQIFASKDRSFLTEPLIAELAARYGWNPIWLRIARSRGTMYSVARRSLLTPGAWYPEGDPAHGDVEADDVYDAYLSSVRFEAQSCVMGEYLAEKNETLMHALVRSPEPPDAPPDSYFTTLTCSQSGCGFRLRSEIEKGETEEQRVEHLTKPRDCPLCLAPTQHVFWDLRLPSKEGPGCTNCGFGPLKG